MLSRTGSSNVWAIQYTAQIMKFSIKDIFSKGDQIRRFLRIWSHLLKKSLMEIFIFCAVISKCYSWLFSLHFCTEFSIATRHYRCPTKVKMTFRCWQIAVSIAASAPSAFIYLRCFISKNLVVCKPYSM